MDNSTTDETLTALKDKQARLQEKLRLYEAEIETADGASSTETAQSLRDQLEQVSRLIEKH